MPKVLDERDVDRLTTAFMEKATSLPRSGYDDEEWLRVVIQTLIVDTELILSGTLTIEDFTTDA